MEIVQIDFFEIEENDELYHEKFDVILKEVGFGKINKILKLEN